VATRLLLLTQWFDPEPTFKGLLFARELARRGFEVEVVTGFPNYPGGKVYPGYRIRWIQRETIDGVRVTRVPLYPSHDRSAFGRVLNYLSFAVSATLYGLLGAVRPSVIYAYQPPLTVGVAAVILRLLRRAPLVYDIQDMWPDTLRSTGMIRSEWLLGLVGGVCRLVYRFADRIVVLSPGFQRLLLERGVPASKVEVIYNWADESAIASAASGEEPPGFPPPGPFRVLFAGNMGKAQALDAVIDAARILQEQGAGAHLVLLGGGLEVERLKRRTSELRLDNVTFLPPVPMARVGAYLAAADALLVHLRRDPLFEITIPSKTQAYLAAGRPVIMAVSGDAASLVSESCGGVVASPEDAGSIAAAIVDLASMPEDDRRAMGRRGLEHYRSRLSVAVGVDHFASTLSDCVHSRGNRDA
jgi:colanic acid biosynthesis glycosyl transferase WcaI